MMKTMMICLISALLFSNLALAAINDSIEFDASKIKKLEISNAKGEILVQASNAFPNKIIVSIEKLQFDKQCQFTQSQSMGTLSIKVEQESGLFSKVNCVAKLKIEIPSKLIDIDVSSSTASIALINTTGTVNFRTAAGMVEIKSDILKNIDGKTATGNMRMSFNKCPSRADIDLMTATGDTDIFLPANCKIKVAHKSATGELFNELGESEDYQVTIVSKSAGGSLKIKKISK